MQEKINKTIVFLIRFAIIMLLIGLMIGFLTWFISNIIFKDVPLEVRTFSEKNLRYLHGHIIIIGFVIPVILAFITNFVKNNIAINKGRVKRLRASFKIYIVGSIAVLTLSTYKGLFYMIKLSQDISISLDQIDSSLFFSSQIFRSISYSIAHPLFVFGLLWYLFVLWNGLGMIKNSDNLHISNKKRFKRIKN